ncbi:sialate O-acetylesterase [Algoriphagus namhaensis]
MKKSLYFLFISVLFWTSCDPASYQSEVILPRIISDGMVLQRGEILKIWGKGTPGAKIRVSLAGVVGSNTVGEDSTWVVELPELQAGGPHLLEVNQQKVEDVYIGDVWLAGGQSNMEWELKSGVIGTEEEFAKGGFEDIRFFKVPHSYSALPQEDVSDGQWKKATPEHMPNFSAVAWFFASKNRAEENVPVGIIESNWGGTPAEGWTEAAVLASLTGSYMEEAKEIVENPDLFEAENQANEKRRVLRDVMVKGPDSVVAQKTSALDFDESSWSIINLPRANPLEHIAWVRKSFNLSEIADAKLTLSTIDQQAYIYLNGQLLHYKDWGVPMPVLDIPSDRLRKGKNVLTIRAINTWNNRPVIGSEDEMYLEVGSRQIDLQGTWAYSNSDAEELLPKVEWLNWKPGMMFNAMIYPLINYPLKGVIWYQGESNAGRYEEYQELFSAMITNWRNRWEKSDLPFLFVQLANFMERKNLQPDSDWAFLREAQRQTLNLPKTGMAVTIDIGEAEDIHPRNKKDVGERLWLLARKVAFKKEGLAEGPVIQSDFTLTDSTAVLNFSSVGKGLQLSTGDKVLGFIVGDDNGDFEAVSAEIISESQVKLALPMGKEIKEIRYAWADNPEVNLVNELGLPAVPFRKVLVEQE